MCATRCHGARGNAQHGHIIIIILQRTGTMGSTRMRAARVTVVVRVCVGVCVCVWVGGWVGGGGD